MHHLQCIKDFRKCKGLAEDRSDEVWSGESIPSGLGDRIDPSSLRIQDATVLEAPYFRCPRCGSLCRPNVWFCHDANYTPRKAACDIRNDYNQWLWALQERKANLVVIECG